MMKRFFWWGLEFGMCLRRLVKGYERRNVKMSLIIVFWLDLFVW